MSWSPLADFYLSGIKNPMSLLGEKGIMQLVVSMNKTFAGACVIRIYDIALYLDTWWIPSCGCFLEWMNQYVCFETNDVIERIRGCSCRDLDRIVRDPRKYYGVEDGDEARYLVFQDLVTRQVPIKEDREIFFAVGACVNFGCGDYEGAFNLAQALHIYHFFLVGSLGIGKININRMPQRAMFDAMRAQARILANVAALKKPN